MDQLYCIKCNAPVSLDGELYCTKCKEGVMQQVADYVNTHCHLCGCEVKLGVKECEKCSQIPASHPYRERLGDKEFWDQEFKRLMIAPAAERNKYRRQEKK